MKWKVPNTNKLDINIDAKSFLELIGLFPSQVIFTRIHLVREGDLLVVAWGEETDFVDPEKLVIIHEDKDKGNRRVYLHSSERACRIGSSGESKNKNPISSLVILHQEFIPACTRVKNLSHTKKGGVYIPIICAFRWIPIIISSVRANLAIHGLAISGILYVPIPAWKNGND